MLVLSRRAGEQIRVGDDVTITMVEVRGGRVKIGIDAPLTTKVVRGELPPMESDEKGVGGGEES